MCKINDNQLWSVYIHEFPDGKFYVGTTSQRPELRWRHDGTGYHDQGLVAKAIKEFGWNNIKHHIAFQTHDREEAFSKETELISKLKSNDPEFGYNISPGGAAGAKGATWSEERKIAYGQKYRGANHMRFGMHHSEASKEKMRAAALQRPPVSDERKAKMKESFREQNGVSVTCFETKQVFRSIADAAESIGTQPCNISVAVKMFPGRTSGGFHWYRSDLDVSHVTIPQNQYLPKRVVCVETNTVYPSINNAAQMLNIDLRHISQACRGLKTQLAGIIGGMRVNQAPKNIKFSFSRLEAWRHCPEMYRLIYIDKVPQQDNAFALYGSFAHKLIELYCKGEIPDFALAEEYKNNYDDAVTRPWPPFPKGMPQKYYEQGLQYFENFAGFGDNFEILSVEEKFELDIGGYPFVGIADLVLRDKTTGEITVIDHKSKSSSTMAKDLPTYRKQLYIYAAYVKQKWGVWPKYLKFNLFRENDWVTEEFDEATYNQVIQWVIDTIEAILKETEWKVSCSSYFCRFVCGVLNECPAKDVVLYQTPKKEKPPDENQS